VNRSGCPPKIQDRILRHQNYKCLYCRKLFGSAYYINGRHTIINVQWDHIVPYSYIRANPKNNWAAACQLCNHIKSDHIFMYLHEAKSYIKRRTLNKYSILETFVPSISNEQDPEKWAREFASYITFKSNLSVRYKDI
jgi:5-methylcytosine-specific restriction endonuclease McrA